MLKTHEKISENIKNVTQARMDNVTITGVIGQFIVPAKQFFCVHSRRSKETSKEFSKDFVKFARHKKTCRSSINIYKTLVKLKIIFTKSMQKATYSCRN